MEPAAPMSASPASAIKRESVELRTRRLAAARRRATALLGAVTILFVVVTAVGAHGTLLSYVQAGAEAAMVGGVADWFAVTALFRHPLGLPIPHTAVIVERKDQFAATLGQFVQENFLNGDVLAERIGSARIASRLADWLTNSGQRRPLRRPRRGHGRQRGRGSARRGCPAGDDRRADAGGRLHRGGPAGRTDCSGHHRGRPSRRAVRHHHVRHRPLPRRPLRGAPRSVRGRGAPLGA